MSKIRLHERMGDESMRPTVVCITTATLFSLWHAFASPNYYLEELSSWLSVTGDAVVDAELYRGLGNVLVITLLLGMIKLVFRRSFGEYGLGLGQWRNAPVLVLATPIMILFAYLAATKPEFRAIYPMPTEVVDRSVAVFVLHAGVLVTYYIAWELLFRGYVQTSLIPQLGVSGAIAVQTLASTLAHVDRPATELLGSIAAGVVWGVFAYRTKSIWPVVLHHFLLGLSLDYWICFGDLS